MKRIGIGALIPLALFVTVGITLVVRGARAQIPEVTKVQGHISPVMAKVTYLSGRSRNVMVIGIGVPNGLVGDQIHSHGLQATGEADAIVTLWLDTISSIKDTTENEALFVLKNGTERTLKLRSLDNTLFIANEDGGHESVGLSKIKSVDFLKPARKDKDGHAMFDHWKYSPFTGEKLPEE